MTKKGLGYLCSILENVKQKEQLSILRLLNISCILLFYIFKEIANHLTDQCIPILLKILSYLPGLSNIDVEGN